MEKKTLTAVVRDNMRKTATRKLRSEGFIPAVVYGSKEPVAIALNARDFGREFAHISEHTIIELKIGKETHEVLIKDYQDDILTGKIQHLDFFEFERGQLLKANIPVNVTGTSIGVKEGGMLEQLTHEVEIECLPKDLPSVITVDITDLGEGDSIKLGELAVPEGARLTGDPDSTVVVITHVSIELEAPAEEEAEIEGAEIEEDEESAEE